VDREILIAVIAGIVVIGVVLFLLWRNRQSQRLRQRFGPEYDRVLKSSGSRSKAERELLARTKRVEKLRIHALTPEERTRFTEAWRTTQARFVDDPSLAVTEADQLVKDVMRTRGYPIEDFEQRAADISVDHPRVVNNYRIARDIALRNQRGEASTEDLRQAVVAYRELFIDLLEEEVPAGNKRDHIVKEASDESRSERPYRH
jgi:FtsZ-interacting cell division protein ZipA